MAKIFISYRRDDSAYATGVIRDQLASNLRDCEIFLDVDSIPYGVDFRRHLESSVGACDYLIAVIGKRWLTVVDTRGQRRLDDPNDAVRVEVETALRREIPLIPVFLDGMMVPTPDELPDSIRDLVSRNAIFVRPPPDFNNDIARLVQSFKEHLKQHQPVLDPIPLVPQTTSLPVRSKRHLLISAIAALGLLALGGAYFFYSPAQLPEYEFQEHYLFEDSEFNPVPWQPHARMSGSGFKSPVYFVHWAIVVKYPKHTRKCQVPIVGRLLDEQGEEVAVFNGLTGDLPDAQFPAGGKTEWFLNLGLRHTPWKPGKYTLQLSTATQEAHTQFEIFP